MDKLVPDQLQDVCGGAGLLDAERHLAIPIISGLQYMAPVVRAWATAAPEATKAWADGVKQYSNFMVNQVHGGHDHAKLIYDQYQKALLPPHLL